MTTLMNILENPLTNTLSKTKLETQSSACCISNGLTLVHAKAGETKNGKTKIEINTKINAISVETFNKWKNDITVILGEETSAIIEAEIISLTNGGVFKFEQYMPIYSLLVFEYAQYGDLDIQKYVNQTNIQIEHNPISSSKINQILESIHKLDTSKIHHQGEIIVSEYNPESTAYIPITIFTFSDQKIITFASYNGSVTFIDQSETIKKTHTYMQVQKKEILEIEFSIDPGC